MKFVPVRPKESRRSSVAAKTLSRLERFLEYYSEGGTVRQNAKKIGITSATVFRHIRSNPEFAEKFAAAQALNTDALEDHLHGLGMVGNVSAVTATLRKRRPDEWRDKASIDMNAKLEAKIEEGKKQELISQLMAVMLPKLQQPTNDA